MTAEYRILTFHTLKHSNCLKSVWRTFYVQVFCLHSRFTLYNDTELYIHHRKCNYFSAIADYCAFTYRFWDLTKVKVFPSYTWRVCKDSHIRTRNGFQFVIILVRSTLRAILIEMALVSCITPAPLFQWLSSNLDFASIAWLLANKS